MELQSTQSFRELIDNDYYRNLINQDMIDFSEAGLLKNYYRNLTKKFHKDFPVIPTANKSFILWSDESRNTDWYYLGFGIDKRSLIDGIQNYGVSARVFLSEREINDRTKKEVVGTLQDYFNTLNNHSILKIKYRGIPHSCNISDTQRRKLKENVPHKLPYGARVFPGNREVKLGGTINCFVKKLSDNEDKNVYLLTSWHAATKHGSYGEQTDMYVPQKDMESKKVAVLEEVPSQPDKFHTMGFDAVIARLYDSTSHNHNKAINEDESLMITSLDESSSPEWLLESEFMLFGSTSGCNNCRVDSINLNLPLIGPDTNIVGELVDQIELRPLRTPGFNRVLANQGDSGAPVLQVSNGAKGAMLVGMVNLSNLHRGKEAAAWASAIRPIFEHYKLKLI